MKGSWRGRTQDAVESKKRETIMVGLNKTKSEIGTLQDSLAAVQLALERREFDLEAKTSDRPCSLPHLAEASLACSSSLSRSPDTHVIFSPAPLPFCFGLLCSASSPASSCDAVLTRAVGRSGLVL